jgi:DNA-binding transcriptional MerR regulator
MLATVGFVKSEPNVSTPIEDRSDLRASSDMSVDQLAQVAGTLTSTVRMYQAKGILPPPRRAGRAAFYGQQHLERLQLIERLQSQGFSLASIKQLVDALAEGTALPEILGLRSRVADGAPVAVVLTPLELVRRLPDVTLTPELLSEAIELGVVELRDDGQFVIPDPRFLDVGAALTALGVPGERLLVEWRELRVIVEQIAGRFAAVFAEHLWPAITAECSDPAALLAHGTAAFDQLAPLAHTVIDTALDRALTAAVDRFAAEFNRSS